MITITDYIWNIYEGFKEYIENQDDKLCEALEFTYQSGKIPDYNHLHIQQLYLLRYAFAYAFEYKKMFKDLFEREQFHDKIKVVSIGCGNRIDYWSLVNALKEVGCHDCRINYKGIDKINWNYKIKKRADDKCKFIEGDVIKFLDEQEKLPANVYIFPKSISEFSDEDFETICNIFKGKQIVNDKIHILISLRSDEGSMNRDKQRSEQIKEAISQNGFKIKRVITVNMAENPPREKAGIVSCDKTFDYPDEAVELLQSISKHCIKYTPDTDSCKKDRQECHQKLDRAPILTTKYIVYQIFTFERKD